MWTHSGECHADEVLLGGTASAIPPIATDVFAHGPSVRLSVCMTVTLVHPAKTVGRNDNDILQEHTGGCGPGNIVQAGVPGPPREGEIWGSVPQSPQPVSHRDQ